MNVHHKIDPDPTPRMVERIHALIHTQPLAYVVGPEAVLNNTTEDIRNNKDCIFVESFEDALLVNKDGYAVRGLYLLPL